MHTELFMRCMIKIVWSLKCVQIGLNDLKTVIDISDKERSGHSAAVEDHEL